MKFNFPDTQPQQSKVEKLINKLRVAANLSPRRTFTYKTENFQSYFPKPEQVEVTGVRTARGFTYLNLNGGDSWGYWHPEDDFEFIHNFKGEPLYKTSELAPSYYIEKIREKRALLTGVRQYYVFRDPRTDTYYAGWHDKNTQQHEFNQVSTKAKLADFLAQYALPAQKVIADWTCTFDPNSPIQIDPTNQYWNRFVPSIYMLQKNDGPEPTIPDTISTVIAHVLGTTVGSPVFTTFLNWLAFAFQRRRATGTAWILQGVPGTGKGILLNHIIKPIFGASNYTARRMEELEDKFNGYLEGCLICYVDEVHIGISKRADMIMANLKNQITEPSITIRNMRQTAYEVPNYLNWVMSSNMNIPISLDKEDRRFNVGAYQKNPLRVVYPDTDQLVMAIKEDLPAFGQYLAAYKVDEQSVRTPLRTESRQDLIDSSLTSLDIIGDALLTGDLELLASFQSAEHDDLMQIKADQYRAIIQDVAKTGRNKLSRDELRTIFLYTVGDVPLNPAKFTRFLTHRGIKLKKVRIGDRITVGIEVDWRMTEELRQEILTGAAPPHLKPVQPLQQKVNE